VNRSRWLPIAGLGLALLMVTLEIFEYLEVVHKRQRRPRVRARFGGCMPDGHLMP
jgi:hypothetical protein